VIRLPDVFHAIKGHLEGERRQTACEGPRPIVFFRCFPYKETLVLPTNLFCSSCAGPTGPGPLAVCRSSRGMSLALDDHSASGLTWRGAAACRASAALARA